MSHRVEMTHGKIKEKFPRCRKGQKPSGPAQEKRQDKNSDAGVLVPPPLRSNSLRGAEKHLDRLGGQWRPFPEQSRGRASPTPAAPQH